MDRGAAQGHEAREVYSEVNPTVIMGLLSGKCGWCAAQGHESREVYSEVNPIVISMLLPGKYG